MVENELIMNKHIFICIDSHTDKLIVSYLKQLEYLKNNFCGLVVSKISDLNNFDLKSRALYMCGDIKILLSELENLGYISEPIDLTNIYIIEELSYNYSFNADMNNLINIGQVPININNVGVYFRNYFSSYCNFFDNLNNEHQFQILTDSNKPSNAYRKGIYITKVSETTEGLKFNLLRCSTNLEGPTDNIRATDDKIIKQVNKLGELFFEQETEFNHVLAQIYSNTKINNVDKKAKIKPHSDKTKDMPTNGLMTFCTFYQGYFLHKFNNLPNDVHRSESDIYDYVYKDITVLTKLRFRLKNPENNPDLVKQFDITLYPNSVFIMSLKSNRLYTHEIVPSILPVEKLPIRMGYVVRCSLTEAVFNTEDKQTYINYNNNLVKLEKASDSDIDKLKNIDYRENCSDGQITYPEINFSLNMGDYMKPNL